jgi:hypothetical protein
LSCEITDLDKELENTNGVIRIRKSKKDRMAKRKTTKGQTTIYKTYIVHITLSNNTTPLKPWVNSGAPEGWTVPAFKNVIIFPYKYVHGR